MIPAPRNSEDDSCWQKQMREAWRDPRALLAWLGHDPDAFALDDRAGFAFLVTQAFAGRMRPGDPGDPLLRQVMPLAAERNARAGFGSDPVGDRASRAAPGLLHKYHGRALMIATESCPIHCRYCFRREFDYRADRPDPDAIVERLRQHREIDELLLSGGDPLMLSNARLQRLTGRLAEVATLRRLRIHSRVPVTLPARVDAGLIDWLRRLPWQVVVVIHANHANEFDAEVAQALARLRATGATVLNQAVLLAGVNDDADTLEALMHAGFAAGALPYYLHQLDRVTGSAHFEVPDDRAVALLAELRRRLPGYLVPRLVRERPGDAAKYPLA